MSGVISHEEDRIVRSLKEAGVFQKVTDGRFIGETKNGGVAIMCSDGDIDAPFHHTRLTHRPHCLRVFGGALMFAPSFGGFHRRMATGLTLNLKDGMAVKQTKTMFLYFHAPCGMAQKYRLGLLDQVKLAREARNYFLVDRFFVREKIHILFHVRRATATSQPEQNTYLVDLKNLGS